jgi:hypothetical protein
VPYFFLGYGVKHATLKESSMKDLGAGWAIKYKPKTALNLTNKITQAEEGKGLDKGIHFQIDSRVALPKSSKLCNYSQDI